MFSSARMDSVEGDPRSEDPINSRSPQPYVVLRIFNRRNPCYRCSFLYDVHATLSAAIPAPRVHSRLARRSQWHRHSCPCAFAKSMTPRMAYAALSAAADFLIANARLEFNVSYSKQNLLKISNRERIAIFHPRFHPLAQKARATTRPPKVQPRLHPLHSSFQPRASSLQNLIANPELEFPATTRKQSVGIESNRQKNRDFLFRFAHFPPSSASLSLSRSPRSKIAHHLSLITRHGLSNLPYRD